MAEPHPFRRAAEAKDLDLLSEALADDVVLHSPILFRGFEGKEIVTQLLTHVAATLEDLTYVDELAGGNTVCLRFKANVGDYELEGIDYLTLDDALYIHAEQLRLFGGAEGVRDLGLIEA